MAVPVLVVTPSPGFGELIAQVMEEAGGYSIALATTSPDALKAAKHSKPALVIVDADLDDKPVDALVGELRAEIKDLLVILIPQGDDEDDAGLIKTVQADGYLSKPFYLPDLLTSVEETIEKSGVENIDRVEAKPVSRPAKQARPPVETHPAPEWLQDVSLAAQHLARLSIESSSQASLVTKGAEIWAYAGELPHEAAQELAATVARYFRDGGGSDLARFVHLDATGAEYMLYSTGLGGDYVLSLVFDAEMPFSKIRAQTNKLASELSSADPPEAEMPKTQMAERYVEEEMIPVSANEPILDDVPPPIPNDWLPSETMTAGDQGFLEELLKEDVPAAAHTAAKLNQEIDRVQPEVAVDVEELAVEPEAEEVMTQVSASELGNQTLPSGSMKGEVDLGETIPSKSTRKESARTLEPISPSMVNLTYACVLIPRMPEHFMTGDLAAKLSEWVTQLSVAFGWRLEQLSIRPDYMQWMVNVPPSVSPGYFMRIIRHHTSRKLFVDFSHFEEQNPSGDFWAPGYLIMSGDQPPPPQLVKDFIKNTRKRQGISK